MVQINDLSLTLLLSDLNSTFGYNLFNNNFHQAWGVPCPWIPLSFQTVKPLRCSGVSLRREPFSASDSNLIGDFTQKLCLTNYPVPGKPTWRRTNLEVNKGVVSEVKITPS